MASGFREFLDAPNVQDSIAKALDHALSHSEGSIYDSHPPLKDRLEAVAKVEGPKSPSHDPPAINWLKNVDQLENQMILHLFKTAGVSSPKTVSWSDVGNQVFVPFWSKYLNDISGNLKGITLWQASEMLESDEFRRKLLNPEIVRHAPEEAQKQLAISIVGLGAIVALSREGWSIQSLPGRPPYATKGEEKIEPAAWIEGFLEKKHTLEELQDYFEACGIDDVEIESLKDKGTQAAKA